MPRTPITDKRERDYLARLGGVIRKCRLEKEMSQEELADASGLTRTYLTELENGQVNVSVLTLMSIARALKVKVPDLLGS